MPNKTNIAVDNVVNKRSEQDKYVAAKRNERLSEQGTYICFANQFLVQHQPLWHTYYVVRSIPGYLGKMGLLNS